MPNKIVCTCGNEVTIRKNIGSNDDIPVVEQCSLCTVAAYHAGWVDGDAATTEETDPDAIIVLMARDAV